MRTLEEVRKELKDIRFIQSIQTPNNSTLIQRESTEAAILWLCWMLAGEEE